MAVSATHRGWLLKHNEGLLAAVYNGALPGTTAHSANTALDGVLVGTPVTPALAVDSLVLSNVVASGDLLLAANNGGNSQAWVHVDSSAGTMVLYGAGVTVATIAATALTIADDILLGVGTGSTTRLSWDTTDANSNQLLLQLPAAGAVDSPVLVIGQSIESVDLGAAAAGADYSGVVDPRIAIFSSGAVTTGPVLEFRKARGTTAAPTVVTTGDDLGTLDFYGAVANGEYVRAASIRADMAGTIATTRGPGTLTFLTATDAPPSVLTAALTLGADQSATFGGAVSIPSGTLTIADDTLLGLGTGNTARLSYDTTDANSNQLLLQLPAAGATDSPVLIIGQSIESIDFGAAAAGADYSGVADPRVALFASGAVTTGPVVEFRKARGTTAAPTVCTTGDDIGQITFYGAVANGEYVQSASIEADIAGTIATTRGPGTLTFKTATDAAPSVLTAALTLGADQSATFAGAVLVAGAVTVNDASADVDVRVETNNMAYAIYSDGAKDSLVLGSNTDTSSVDQLINITRAARTATAATAYYDLAITPAGAVTVPAGVTALVATVRIDEPNITATGTVTLGATLYVGGQPTEGSQNVGIGVPADVSVGLGAAGQARLLWESADTDSNQLLLQLPAAGATDSPVLIIGQAIENVDIGAAASGADYSAVADPRIAIFASGAVTTGPVVEFRKARGTTAAPTVCTTGDDIGQVTFYGAVANGEYVQSASIEADIAGTIATTRGPGTLTFKTATDAAPSVLTAALTISAAQLVTCAAGVTVTTGNVTISSGNLALSVASDITIPAATAAAVEVSDGTTKFYAVDTRVATVGVTTHAFDISDYTLASAAGAVATGLSLAAHTLNLTGNTQVTTQVDTVVLGARTIAADGVPGACTVDEANTLVVVAPTEGTNAVVTAAAALRVLNAGGTPVNQYGIYIEDLTVGATSDYGIYIAGADTAAIFVASADPILLGLAGTGTGRMQLAGTTSGVVTLTVAAAAGTWTMQLPAAVGGAGEQLTDAGANGITSWAAAASSRELKDIHGEANPEDALKAILGTPVYHFHYKDGAPHTTGDYQTDYVGVIADEAPWAMHYNGGIVNPVNTLGYSVLGIQALYNRIHELERKVTGLAA